VKDNTHHLPYRLRKSVKSTRLVVRLGGFYGKGVGGGQILDTRFKIALTSVFPYNYKVKWGNKAQWVIKPTT